MRTLAVVRDKLTADPLLEERTCLPMDNLMEMLKLCVETTYFGVGSDIYWQDEGLVMGLPLSPVLANIYMEILRRNGIRIYITKAIYVCQIRRWHIHSLASLGRCSDITWSRELNPTIYTVHYEERARQQITLPWCISNTHRARIQVIPVP